MLREGQAISVVAMIQSLLRGLAPLLAMLDSNCHWPQVGDGVSGFINVTEAVGAAAYSAASIVACAGARAAYGHGGAGAHHVHGGCYVSLGSGTLQFATMDGVRRSFFVESDAWEISRPTPLAITLYTSSYATVRPDGLPTRGDGLPRALSLHAGSASEASRWEGFLRQHQRSNNFFGSLCRWTAGKADNGRSWRADTGTKPGISRPSRLSYNEANFIAFGLTVRLAELSLTLCPCDPRTANPYSAFASSYEGAKHPAALSKSPAGNGAGAHSASVTQPQVRLADGSPSRRSDVFSVARFVGSLGEPLLRLSLRCVGYDYFVRLHDVSMLLTINELVGTSSVASEISPVIAASVAAPFCKSLLFLFTCLPWTAHCLVDQAGTSKLAKELGSSPALVPIRPRC